MNYTKGTGTEIVMKYGLIARAMPLIFDRSVCKYLSEDGVTVDKKMRKSFRQEYKAIVSRTPGLARDNWLSSTLYLGCYLISIHKAAPEIITEERFERLIRALCEEMERRQKESDEAFDEKNIVKRKMAAEKSQSSAYEMDWVSTFKQHNADEYEFTYTKCDLCELGKREECFHLIKYLCMSDYVTFNKSGARLVRDHTIANGDGYCDFHVYRKEMK